jgi:hypothetical protein
MLVALAMAGCFAATIAGGQTAQPLRLPPFRAGDQMTFMYASNSWNKPPSPTDGAAFDTFDIRVLDVSASGVRIEWTLRSEAGSGDDLLDIPVEVDVDPSGVLRSVLNADAIREEIFRRYPEFGPPDDSATLKRQIESRISDLLKRMSVFQTRAPIAPGHALWTDVYDESVPGLQHTVARKMDLVGVNPEACLAHFLRHSVQTCRYKGAPCESPIDTTTSATVSTEDGWIVELHTFLKFEPGFRQTIDIRRLTPVTCRNPT